jgi:TonB family protein
VIVLPASTLIGLTPAQVELVIAHELAHVRRLDYLVNALQIALETVLFYHPVVHWISRSVRHDREACCDDLVLAQGADPVVYARALANLEELREVPAPVLAATGGFLLGRIRRIVGLDPVFAMPRTVPLGVLVLLLAAAALISQRQLSQPMPALSLDTPVLLMRSLHAPKPAPVPVPADVSERASVSLPELIAPATDATIEAAAATKPARPAFATARPQRPDTLRQNAIGDLALAPQSTLHVLEADAAVAFALHRVAPVFPQRARITGIEGRVTLGFSVDRAGQAREIRVLEATPLGEFEAAATQALREWRFNAAAVTPGQRYTQVFDFALADPNKAEGESEADCRFPMGSRICRRDLPPADLEEESAARAATPAVR